MTSGNDATVPVEGLLLASLAWKLLLSLVQLLTALAIAILKNCCCCCSLDSRCRAIPVVLAPRPPPHRCLHPHQNEVAAATPSTDGRACCFLLLLPLHEGLDTLSHSSLSSSPSPAKSQSQPQISRPGPYPKICKFLEVQKFYGLCAPH